MVLGGLGSDVVSGGADQDWVLGEGGDDELRAADGAADYVDGGGGYDVCFVNPSDTVTNCEDIR